MTLLAFLLLLTVVPAGSARSRHPPKAAISSPVFGPRQVHGVRGGSVTVRCFYPPTPLNRHDRKYWCRQRGSGCLTVVSSDFVAAAYQGRVTLTDHPEQEHFQVHISELEPGDAGTFQCGLGVNGRGLSFRVTLSVAEAPPVPEDAELFYVKLRSTWTVSCSFGEGTAEMRKYLCKKEKDGCRNIIDSYQDEDPTGRLQLTFENPPGSFRVTMTRMDWEDAGLYYCGAGEYGKDSTSKELDVFVYEDKNFPHLKTNITAKTGSSATFECLYEPLLNSSTRFWCKQKGRHCVRIIDSTGRVEDTYEGRVAAFENPENKTVTIVLNQLRDKDKGSYWCMSNELREQQSSTELTVVPGEPALTGKKKVEAQAGSRVNLTCCYPCAYSSYEKFWCRWSSTGCAMLPAQQPGLPQPGDGCDRSARTLVLSLDALREEDEGWYWCGVKRNGVFGETMAVELRVSAGRDAKLSPEFLGVGSSRGPGAAPPGGAGSGAEVRKGAAPESSDESHGSHTLALVLGPLAGLILIVVTAFAIVKYRQLKRSDLVSVGSYRTNISMSDFESVRDFSASNSVKESQETPMGGDEFITTTDTPDSAATTAKAKRSSKEDADLAYSSFLATSSGITQASSGGDSAVLDVSPPQDRV
ncbi:polymeric immunoglobulin receptor [Haemorhous mexicanus]|uniref:polymeric immunoglobulin receptor n=1 Tax=Haemorhous mexicanus TaxID=30427 RepID=UPI0028BEBBCB|nr:polymeric immunoglobulin receptor [Haemorhous mexicanus]